MKHIILGFIFLMSINTSLTGYTVIQDKTTLTLLSPQLASRKTLKIRLANGLQAYLISDPDADQSGAALAVQTGSWEDPDELPGLAHFLEHMLFLGTEKYPVESEFSQFISQQGGLTNAFTTNDTTSFLFTVNNQALSEALQRFASFFIAPLFNPSGTLRELHAVDQEYMHNAQNDSIRLLQVLQELGNKKHPYSRFTMGNFLTLQHTKREELISWYEKHYSPELMRLVVLSPLPIEQLVELVEKDFQSIPMRTLSPRTISEPLTSKEYQGSIAYIVPLQEIQTMVLTWEIEEFAPMKNEGVDMLIALLLGDESEHSLAYQLKRQGLAEALFCGLDKVGKEHYQLFISIDLTTEGVQQADKVIQETFGAINFFKSHKAPAYIFEEMQKLAKLKYQYQSRQPTFQEMEYHAENIAEEEIASYPQAKAIPQKFNREGLERIFNSLKPQKALIALMAQPSLTGVHPDQTEKWLGVAYKAVKIKPELLDAWQGAKASWNIDFPPPNPFIPKNLSLIKPKKTDQKETSGPIPKPKLLIDSDEGRFFCASDAHFCLPEVAMHFQIKTEHIDAGDAFKTALTDLYVSLLEEKLNTTDYLASLAGLEAEIQREDFGISITLNGYSDTTPVFLAKILQAINAHEFSLAEFKIQKESLLRDYQNDKLQPPLEQAQELTKDAIYKARATPQAKASALKKINYPAFLEFSKTLFEKAYVEGMLFGNIEEKEGLKLCQNFLCTLKASPYPKKEQSKQQVITFDGDTGPLYLEFNVHSEGNSLILSISQGQASFEKRAIQKIASEAISEPFFTELRTVQQTGYIVYNTTEEIEGHLFTLFAAQSSRYDPQDLLYRFEKFLEEYFQKPKEQRFSEADFTLSKINFLIQLKNPAKNTKAMGKLLNRLAFIHNADFNYFDKLIAAFEELSYETFSTKAQGFLSRSNKHRLAIMAKGLSTDSPSFSYRRINSINELHKLLPYQGAKD